MELAASRPRYGYRRLWILLRREGWRANHKLIYRLYKEEGLSVPTRLCILTLIDQYSRECLALHADTSVPSARVTQVLDHVIATRGRPSSMTVDNGTEFTAKHLDAWAYSRSITVDYLRPGRPVENAHIESFNGRLREECLSQHWFRDLTEARGVLAAWKRDYNESRPHTSLGGMPPSEYAQQLMAWAGYEEAMAISRVINPVLFTVAGPFHHDPASAEAGFVATELRRETNRIARTPWPGRPVSHLTPGTASSALEESHQSRLRWPVSRIPCQSLSVAGSRARPRLPARNSSQMPSSFR
jgi:putative transposase